MDSADFISYIFSNFKHQHNCRLYIFPVDQYIAQASVGVQEWCKMCIFKPRRPSNFVRLFVREGLKKKNMFFIHILWISVLPPPSPPLSTFRHFIIILQNIKYYLHRWKNHMEKNSFLDAIASQGLHMSVTH